MEQPGARERLDRSLATLERWMAENEEVDRQLGQLEARARTDPTLAALVEALREALSRQRQRIIALRDEIQRL